ncbi:MAG: hypothetical protein Q8S32_01625 [Burkholderiaceae bacterium]|nr:hypothetical protein [Burkholderiaceae bacterium]MDP3422441.1 hypothetical protein [Burkholderiaceae bacterium]MDZ4160256.1 hypothetical protein [Burkholderiales bacterium]
MLLDRDNLEVKAELELTLSQVRVDLDVFRKQAVDKTVEAGLLVDDGAY